jgi:hypothetical protein
MPIHETKLVVFGERGSFASHGTAECTALGNT